MLGQQLSPLPVAELARPLRRVDDVGEQHGGQDPVEHGLLVLDGVQELVQERQHVRGVVVRARGLREPGPRDAVGQVPALGRADHAAESGLDDQGRALDSREQVAHVQVAPHQLHGQGGPRAQRVPRQPAVAADELPVAGLGREQPVRDPLDEVRRAPLRLDGGQPLVPLAVAPPERVVRCPATAHLGRPGHQRRDPFRVSRREQQRLCDRVLLHVQHRPLGAGGVHHRADVVHPRVQRRDRVGVDAVGQPGAAPVEQQQPRAGAQAAQQARGRRPLPDQLHVRHEAGQDRHHVDRSVADHLVGDVDAVGRLRVPGAWDLDVVTGARPGPPGGCGALRPDACDRAHTGLYQLRAGCQRGARGVAPAVLVRSHARDQRRRSTPCSPPSTMWTDLAGFSRRRPAARPRAGGPRPRRRGPRRRAPRRCPKPAAGTG